MKAKVKLTRTEEESFRQEFGRSARFQDEIIEYKQRRKLHRSILKTIKERLWRKSAGALVIDITDFEYDAARYLRDNARYGMVIGKWFVEYREFQFFTQVFVREVE